MNTSLAPLMDSFGRRVDYLRVSVTDRCDLRCSYCLPKGFKDYEESEDWLSFEELERVINLFSQMGTSRVRLTGGEPLLRRNLSLLAARISALPGISDLSLTTNGTQLAKQAMALRQAGVSRLNISLDSLSRECVERISGRDSFESVIAGIEAARTARFAPIKINMVVMPGVNADQIEEMMQFCFEKSLVLRLIETMPMGTTGLQSGFVSLSPLIQALCVKFDLVPEIKKMGAGPARYWRTRDGRGSLGVITPISQHFCETCNRVRLSVDGTLYLCLGQEDQLALRPLIRGGATDAELREAIRGAILRKPERHDFEKTPEKIVRFMSQTGG